MTKHYKSLGLSLLAVLIVSLAAIVMRPYFKVTPAVHIDYEELVRLYAREYRLEPALVFAVIKTESNFDAAARSGKDAYGLMQITEATLNWAMFREDAGAAYTIEDLYDPEINIKYGCLILSLLLEEFEDTDTALAAYNAGRGNAIKWLKDSRYSSDGIHIKDTPYKETTQYIKKVNKYHQKYREMLGESA
ncbi:MAG: lytic transglycosylase domain-containing protein [Clostridia bacterium]|nr:lytic transglycosylase domain-containing protein [Clostridia bacterium]